MKDIFFLNVSKYGPLPAKTTNTLFTLSDMLPKISKFFSMLILPTYKQINESSGSFHFLRNILFSVSEEAKNIRRFTPVGHKLTFLNLRSLTK